MLIEPWHTVRACWEEHARYLFQEYCSVYQVLQEAQFANDEGKLASDTILAEIHKSSSGDCVRRPVRLFQKKEVQQSDNADGGGGGGGSSNKDTACETIGRKKFIDCLKLINPLLSVEEVFFLMFRLLVSN